MRPLSTLSMFVLAGALLASPVWAVGPSPASIPPADRSAQTDEDTQSPPDVSERPATNALEGIEPTGVEGRVAAIEHDSGRFVLETERGPLSLVTTPDELVGVKVGDMVRVAIVIDEGGN
jgi:hypothetical protein